MLLQYINFNLIKTYVLLIFIWWLLTRPVDRTMKKKGKKFPFSWFYVPKGKKSKPIYIHLIGLLTGFTFFLASILAFPIFLVLTWLGYSQSQDEATKLTLALSITYISMLIINRYRKNIERYVEVRTGLNIKG